MRAFLRTTILFSTLFVPTISAIAAEGGRDIVTIKDADFFGHDLRTVQSVTLDQCKSACIDDNECKAFTYNPKAQWCFLKSDFDKMNAFPGAVAGKIVVKEVAQEPDIGKAPDLAFIDEYQKNSAASQRKNLTVLDGQAGLSVETLVVMARRDLAMSQVDHAVKTLSSALVKEPDNAALWIELARTANTVSDNWQINDAGLNAAINGYQLTRKTSERADALAVLAKALEQTKKYRAGINAYKESVKLVDNPEVQAALADLQARWGFRITNNTIDADAADPRACFQFSENLVKSGVDYTSYLTLNGEAPSAVVAENSQICVEGLKHGERYKISLREGLPSSVDEPLKAQADFDIYVRDRAPTVRFTGDSFVLPSTARHGIPLVSINSSSVKLKLYRVGDRNITSILTNTQFLTQLGGYTASRVADDQGQLVWSGAIDVNPELNKEVVTSFPVDEALPERKPGVYILTAVSAQKEGDEWDNKATQWFVVSDIGINTYAGTDGLNVFVRSLASAKPMANASLKLLARNNEILGQATTDENGRATFSPGLMRGTSGMTPAMLTAENGGKDYVFLDLTRAGFDLSDRGVTGRTAPGAVDVFTWTERGVYRAGETVHVASLARDVAGQAIEKLPLTFIFTRPDGVEDRRIVSTANALGGYTLDLPLQTNAMLGIWTVRSYTDPNQSAISEQNFLVEDFVPDRIELNFSTEAAALEPGLPVTLDVEGKYLYGAPGAGLLLDGTLSLSTSRTREEFKGYEFGLVDEESQEQTRVTLEALPVLDEKGQAKVQVTLPELPVTTRFLNADITLTMREAGGRGVAKSLDLPVNAGNEIIGIKRQFEGDAAENSLANFHVIGLDSKLAKQPMTGLSWRLTEIHNDYQWYRDGSSWRYEPVTNTKLVASGKLDLTKDGGSISAPVTWGRYRLEVESAAADGPATSIEFDAGWYVSASSTETPDGLEIGLDKESYKVGEIAKLKVSPRFAGELLVNIGTENLVNSINASISAEGGVVEVPITKEMGSGAYITATPFRPGDAQESRMPMRAIGIKWVTVDPGDSKLNVSITAPEQTLPNKTLGIDLAVAGAGANEEAYITVAAVDVGILNLTGYETPDPDSFYFGQRMLGLEIRDLYGRLIDGSLGAMGKLRNGGDGTDLMDGQPPTEKLLSFFTGPVKLDAKGKAHVDFELPQFNGTARIMTVAWSKSGVGHAEKDVIIREPVVAIASLPRFLAPADKAELRLDIANTDGPAGEYTLTLAKNDLVSFEGDATKTVKLEKGAKTNLILPIVGKNPGKGALQLTLAGPDGININQAIDVEIRPSTIPMTERRLVKLEPGRKLLVDDQLLANNIMQGASVSVNVTSSPAFDVPALLMALDRYPYGCAEQTTSRALPLLYLSELSASSGLPDDAEVKKRVQEAIYKVLSYQSSSGSYGLWSPGSGDFWLDDYVTDFLTRAREQKYDVPEQAIVLALDNLENQLAYDNNVATRGNEMAYAMYVLARNRRAAISDLRYFADTMLDQFPTPLAKAHVAAALALYGDNQRAERIFGEAVQMSGLLVNVDWARSDYGSNLRDDAAILALAAESRISPAITDKLTQLVTRDWNKTTYLSTQEQTWLVLAARALKAKDETIRLSVNGEAKSGGFETRLTGEELASKPIDFSNQGQEPVTAVITTVASPKNPLPAGGEGFEISRAYYTLDGEEANVSDVKQNDRFIAVITVKQTNGYASRLMVNDLLPAGFEINNPDLVSGESLANFDWLPVTEAAHLEFRADRFQAALNTSGDMSEIKLAYMVRAVNPGVFDHPAATVEDMYRPQFSARTATGRMQVTKN